MNTVNLDNFNATMIGYIVRACQIAELDGETRKKILQGIKWATSEMTMEDARREYEQYRTGNL
ncbi:MAG: hypothetical protein GXY49_14265 [Syntrophomonadaceae bacterium]|jgi:hypothetical protein|nr:hypothetical protein [Syntrophomonadaceae bacterium]